MRHEKQIITMMEMPCRSCKWPPFKPTFVKENNKLYDWIIINMYEVEIVKEDKTLYGWIIKHVWGSKKTKGEYRNENLLVSKTIYSLLNRANNVKVEARLAPPPLASLSILHTQSCITGRKKRIKGKWNQ